MVDLDGTSSNGRGDTWDPGEAIISKSLSHFLSYLSGMNDVPICGTEEEWDKGDKTNDRGSRTELDSHANMPVVGSEAYLICFTHMDFAMSTPNPI